MFVKHSLLALAVSGLTAALCMDAAAADVHSGKDPPSRSQHDTQSRHSGQIQHHEQRAGEREVRGHVVNQYEMVLSGVESPHTVVELQTRGGQRYTVDLGPSEDLKDTDISKGSWLFVRGSQVQAGNRSVILASDIRTERDADQPDDLEERWQSQDSTAYDPIAHMQGDAEQDRNRERTQARATRTAGEILQMKSVEVRGTDAAHRVALLLTDEGNKRFVDFGPEDRLEVLNLEEGKRVLAIGNRVRVGGQPVIMADWIGADGQIVEVERDEPWTRTMEAREITGHVIAVEDVDYRGADDDSHVVMLKTDSGRRIVVDLGPSDRIEEEGIKSDAGERLAVEGRDLRIGDRIVMLAERIKAGDVEVDVDRDNRSESDDQ